MNDKKERNLSAIWSMIFGILALLSLGLNPLFTLPAIILGFVSRGIHKKHCKRSIAGLIMGLLSFIIGLLVWFIFAIGALIYLINVA